MFHKIKIKKRNNIIRSEFPSVNFNKVKIRKIIYNYIYKII